MSKTHKQGGETVFVAGVSGGARNISPQLRLDGANGYNKYIFIKKGSGACMIDGVTQGFGTNTVIYIPDSCPHHVDLGVNTQAVIIAVPTALEFNLPETAIVQALTSANDITTMAQKIGRAHV